ncbi:MAG: bifunctional riboflavin kinase/FAD synthetase [Deltaproteobacteria bacterium]|nr:bifunctional riboflavin kinase/FAD synthetase [Deltaproteobacteria bacterium]
MKIFHQQELPPEPWSQPVLSLGNFDGVHLGHRRILERLVQRARQVGGEAVVATFHPHPARILRPDRAPLPLISLQDRLGALKEAGAEGLWVIPFDEAFARREAGDFVRECLVSRLGIQGLVLGPDARLGRDRRGGPDLLRDLGAELDFFVEVVPDVELDGERISSTRIRQVLREGRVEHAARLLGRSYRLRGEVSLGHRRGRRLGFPTANLKVEDLQLPGHGIYACRAFLEDSRGEARELECVTSIGVRPTFDNGPVTVEAHLLDFDENIYGHLLTLEFVRKLREERKFPSVEALVEAMYRDVADTRRVLAGFL